MTRPYQQWPTLWEFFMLFHQDWRDDFPDEESAMLSDLEGWSSTILRQALDEWHEAFDGASGLDVENIVGDMNPSYAPEPRFGSSRGWADWIRQHLETELAERAAGRRQEPVAD